MTAIVYSIFFLSGASALIYEVSWVRALILVFGGSHLAVTAVLSVFMAGLALGGHLIGRRADSLERPLRTYGILEIGIALAAGSFLLLVQIYPSLYVPLARGAEGNPLYLTFLRVSFAVVAMAVPTILMGGTLPLMTRFVSDRSSSLGSHLSFLYGVNTLGAVAGTLLAGFYFLPGFGLLATQGIAIATNLLAGGIAMILQGVIAPRSGQERAVREGRRESMPRVFDPGKSPGLHSVDTMPSQNLVLWGIAISGFCALGYEVLWTRVLGIVIGTSVYGFTIMLVSFLAGIALGSQAYGYLQSFFRGEYPSIARSVTGFGLIQIMIGAAALAVTYLLRDLPSLAIRVQNFILRENISPFDFRQTANFLLSISIMFVPAFFMGVAFPMAGNIRIRSRDWVGWGVGEIVTYNTFGAILGAAVSGFALIYLFGIERSLQLLSVINIGFGLTVASSVLRRRALSWAVAGLTAVVFFFLGSAPDWGKMWNAKYFAIYRNNQVEAFNTRQKIQEALKNTDVLFNHAGINETISVIHPKGGNRALLVNGKVVASSTRQDRQCQYTLGHLPMLLHKNPKKVWVLGMGTGMTVGATSVHPEVGEVTLLEIEGHVVDAARKFAAWNHEVADNPRLEVVINDGRNFLMTTDRRYDVTTADPIHPWTRGSSYLYTAEYYRLAAQRLLPGGIFCQWVPIYELTVDDLKSIVITFGENFRYMMLWLTQYDGELIGSNEPIVIDEAELSRRIQAAPAVAADLDSVEMGSATDFLSYFVMGTEGLRSFSRGGIVNTDDNLHLEFSAPKSIGLGGLMGTNVQALTRHRESLLPYLAPAAGERARREQKERWDRAFKAAEIYDRAHSLFLWGKVNTEEYEVLSAMLDGTFPQYAPGRFLKKEYLAQRDREPRLLRAVSCSLLGERGERTFLEISAVTMRIGEERGVVMFVDNRAREIYGQMYMDGPREELDSRIPLFAEDVLVELEKVCRGEAGVESHGASLLPRFATMSDRFKRVITGKIHASDASQATGD